VLELFRRHQLLLFASTDMHVWRTRFLRDGLSRYTVLRRLVCAGPGQTKRYGPWHVITCSQGHSRLLRNLLNGWCQPRSQCAPRSWPSANIESKSCTTCLGPFVLRKPACARTLICQRHQSQFEGVSARVCDGRKLGIYIYVYIHTYRQEGFELATRPRLLWSPSSSSIKTGGSEL